MELVTATNCSFTLNTYFSKIVVLAVPTSSLYLRLAHQNLIPFNGICTSMATETPSWKRLNARQTSNRKSPLLPFFDLLAHAATCRKNR